MPKLAHAINRLVIVAAPGFFGDAEPRRCTLVDMEPCGLWLGGAAVSGRLPEPEGVGPVGDAPAAVFFPFAQIGYLFDPVQVGARAGRAGVRAGEAKAGKVVDEGRAMARGEGSHSNRSRHKASKQAR